jgi:hypothetical protein
VPDISGHFSCNKPEKASKKQDLLNPGMAMQLDSVFHLHPIHRSSSQFG